MPAVMPVVLWFSAALAFAPAVFIVWAIGREGRKSRELYALYRDVVAARTEHRRPWTVGAEPPGAFGLGTSELKHLIVSRRARESTA